MFFKKEKTVRVDEVIMGHLKAVHDCRVKFGLFLDKYFKSGLTEEVHGIVTEIDELETNADRVRHEIIRMLISGALLPDTRREMLKLIEYVDRIANDAEEISKQIVLQKISFPENIKTHLTKISQMEDVQMADLEEVIKKLFSDIHDIDSSLELIKKIEHIETEVDKIEYEAIKEVYEMDIELAEKVQLKDAISAIAGIADLIENISDLLEIIIATRRV